MSTQVNDQRSKFAFEEVERIAKEGKAAKEFRSLIRSYPIMLYNHGLSAAVAYLYNKKGSAYKKLHGVIEKWLILQGYLKEGSSKDQNKNNNSMQDKDKLMNYIVNTDSETYRRMLMEVLDLVTWMKRFAEGMIEADE